MSPPPMGMTKPSPANTVNTKNPKKIKFESMLKAGANIIINKAGILR